MIDLLVIKSASIVRNALLTKIIIRFYWK